MRWPFADEVGHREAGRILARSASAPRNDFGRRFARIVGSESAFTSSLGRRRGTRASGGRRTGCRRAAPNMAPPRCSSYPELRLRPGRVAGAALRSHSGVAGRCTARHHDRMRGPPRAEAVRVGSRASGGRPRSDRPHSSRGLSSRRRRPGATQAAPMPARSKADRTRRRPRRNASCIVDSRVP